MIPNISGSASSSASIGDQLATLGSSFAFNNQFQVGKGAKATSNDIDDSVMSQKFSPVAIGLAGLTVVATAFVLTRKK